MQSFWLVRKTHLEDGEHLDAAKFKNAILHHTDYAMELSDQDVRTILEPHGDNRLDHAEKFNAHGDVVTLSDNNEYWACIRTIPLDASSIDDVTLFTLQIVPHLSVAETCESL